MPPASTFDLESPTRTIRLQEASFGEEEISEAMDSLRSTMVVMGAKCRAFESAWSAWQGSPHSVFVNSGSSANLLIISMLKSLRTKYKLQEGDEILVPAVTWSTTLFPIIQLGLKPVLVDVKPHTFNIDVESCARALTERTRAIFIVHLLGNPCHLDELTAFARAHNLILLEDCCEAHGAEWNGVKVGNFSQASAFSFMFAHHMTTIEGGMVCCPDGADYRVVKAQRAHGWIREFSDDEKADILAEYEPEDERFFFWDLGFNVRPTEINAAFGLHQLAKLDNFIAVRKQNFEAYMEGVQPILDLIQIQALEDDVAASRSNFAFGFYLKDSRVTRRELVRHLESRRIESRTLVAGNLCDHPFFQAYLGCDKTHPLPVSEMIHRNGLYLPNHQSMTVEDVRYVTTALVEFLRP